MTAKKLAKRRKPPDYNDINATFDANRETPMADTRRPLEAAADFARGGGPPAPDHDADHAHRASRVEAEQRRLIQWAKESKKLGRGKKVMRSL